MRKTQDQFFKDEIGGMSKAINDLTTAISPSSGNYNDRAVNQVKPENRDSVIKSVQLLLHKHGIDMGRIFDRKFDGIETPLF